MGLVQVFKGVRDWYTVGLKLNLTTDDLDVIKSFHVREQLPEVFRLWLQSCSEKGTQPSWRRVAEVLEELNIYKPLREIRDRYSMYIVISTIQELKQFY